MTSRLPTALLAKPRFFLPWPERSEPEGIVMASAIAISRLQLALSRCRKAH
jgi:hypothetical protein